MSDRATIATYDYILNCDVSNILDNNAGLNAGLDQSGADRAEEAAALIALLTLTIDGDRYPPSPRVGVLREM